MASTSNDVPEFLNELIPYRCPKCGHLRRFATLRELRQHLQLEHSFQMGFIKPHARAHVFKGARDSSKSSSFSRSLSSEDMFNGTRDGYSRSSVNELRRNNNEYDCCKKFTRETSPLLKSFKEETELLENELQQAIQNEMKHKTLSMNNLTETSINADFKKSLEEIQRPQESQPKAENTAKTFTSNYPKQFHTNFVNKTKPYVPSVRGQTGPNYDFKSTLDSLNSEVMKSRMNQWVTTDALYKSQDLLREMETAAEIKCQEQKGIIEQLMKDMKTKDAMLESQTKHQAELSTERQRLLDETESIVKQTDEYNTRLRHELDGRGKILEGLNKELERLKTYSEQEIKCKDNDLQNAEQKIRQMEWERDRLIQETDSILKRADKDTGKLRETLQVKEEQLKNVNKLLNQLRQQQQTMLERTMTVYRSSEESREIMKTAIQTKDGQLQHAMKQIENMTSLHKRLLEQSQILTDQADDNTSSMKRLLHAKEEQIQDLVQQLDILKREKRYLEENTVSLAEQAETSVSVVQKLRDMVKQKENDLKTTQSELKNLKSFLKSTADKERTARQKLEVFVEDLIKRAELAESELHVLKSQSSQSASTLHDVKMDSFSDLHNSESTIRKSLPTQFTIEPSQLHHFNAANHHQTTLSKSYNGLKDSTPQSFRQLPLKNMLLTTTDVHQFQPDKGDITSQSNSDANKLPGNHFSNGTNIECKNMEESGGFIVQEESCLSTNSNYLNSPHILTESNKSTSYLEQNDIHKLKRRKKSRGSRNRIEQSFESSSNDECTDFRKRRKNSFGKHVKGTFHQYAKGSGMTGFDKEKIANTSDGTDSEGQSHTEYYQLQGQNELITLKKRGKVSKELQVGSFLSNQDLENESEIDSGELDSGSGENGRCDDIRCRSLSRSLKPMEGVERPETMGKSPKSNTTGRENIHHKKSKQKPKHYLKSKFDTNPQTVHRSMVNLTRDGTDLSEGEILLRNEDRHRRSRSLSPRTMAARTSYPMKEIKYDEVTSSDDDVSIHENDVVENTDGVFDNIMDDNGILWDDDDATLPDVSDSELDRVSPSGSEALTTKHTSNTMSTVYLNPRISPKKNTRTDRMVKENRKSGQFETGRPSSSHDADLLSTAPNKFGRRSISSEMKTERTDMRKYSHSSAMITEVDLNDTEESKDNLEKTKVTFRPIKSPLFSKSSASERDLTSGGKEVKNIMNASPNVNITGSQGTTSLGSLSPNSRIRSRSSGNLFSKSDNSSYASLRNSAIKTTVSRIPTLTSTSRRIDYTNSGGHTAEHRGKIHSNVQSRRESKNTFTTKESIDERIEKISSTYSPKHSDVTVKTHGNSQFHIDEKIRTISNKYSIRRNDIVQGKGISPSHANARDIDRHIYSSRPPSVAGTSLKSRSFLAHEGAPLSKRKGFDETTIHQGISQLRQSPRAEIQNRPSLAETGFQGHAFPSWSSINDNTNGHPYIPYPFLYPPNLNQQLVYPFFPGNADSILQQQLPNLQLQTQQHQQLQQQQQQQQQQVHKSEEQECNKEREYQGQEQDQGQQNKQQTRKEHNEKQEQSMCDEDQKEESRNNVASPYGDTLSKLKTDLTEERLAKEGEMKEYERSHSTDSKTRYDFGRSIESGPKQDSTLVEEQVQENVDLFGKHSTELTSIPETHTNIDECQNKTNEINEELKDNDDMKAVSLNDKSADIERKMENELKSTNISNQCTQQANINADIKQTSRLSLFGETDNDESSISMMNKSSMFAEEIGKESSAEYDSNTQSLLDLPDGVTDTDIEGDTDTESVRKDFYENTNRIKELLDSPQNDFSDVYRHKFSRNTTSSASSQG